MNEQGCDAINLLPPHYSITIHIICEKRRLSAQIFGAFEQIDGKVVIQGNIDPICKGTKPAANHAK